MMRKKILCIIPARINSTRLPRKPLFLIKDKPMIQWTYEAAQSCPDFDRVIVATDSQEIIDVVEAINGFAQLTPSELKTGTDRVAYLAKQYPEYDVIVNVQGDEPFVQADMLSALVKPFIEDENVSMTTLASPLNFETDYHDPNTVKVIYDKNFNALYFSRSPIPFFRELKNLSLKELSQVTKKLDIPIGKHIGLYAYSKDFLENFINLTQTPLEIIENLEQLRVLENCGKIRVCFTNKRTVEINTLEDLKNIPI